MILEVKGVSKSFGGLMAVKSASIVVEENTIWGLIGPNGSGKTTLFNLITGFLKPDSGQIIFKSEVVTNLKPNQICKRGIGRTFQLVRPFVELTVLQNVMIGSFYGSDAKFNMKQAIMEAEEVLQFVGLWDKRNMLASHLTLADRKMLELGRALAAKPQMLLLDELMAGLAPSELDATMRLLQEIRNSGITIIMVEHIIKAVMGLCDKISVLSAGEKIAEGTPQEVANNQQVIDAYFGAE